LERLLAANGKSFVVIPFAAGGRSNSGWILRIMAKGLGSNGAAANASIDDDKTR
jgi:hypothetical protein